MSKFYFGAFAVADLAGVPCFITRTGYTGEDGFEISIPNESALKVTELLMAADGVALAGLGARDSLRLEAGLCLYGNDLNEDISPIEAGLAWTVGVCPSHAAGSAPRLTPRAAKRRREAFDFLGGAIIKKQLADGVARRRVGLVVPEGAPARQHAKLLGMDGKEIGCGEACGAGSPLYSPSSPVPPLQGGDERRLLPMPAEEHRHGLCGHSLLQAWHPGHRGGAGQEERRRRRQDALRPRQLLQGGQVMRAVRRGV